MNTRVTSALRAAALVLSASRRVKVGKFRSTGDPEFAEADVTFDGVMVGTITRLKSDDFVGATSFARRWVVSGYEMAFDSPDLDNLDSPVTKRQNAKEALAALLDDIEEVLAKPKP